MANGISTILQANNMYRIAKANWEKEVQTRAAGNKLQKAGSDLANWSRSLGNQKRVKAAAEEFNRGVETLSHETRQMGKQGSSQDLKTAQQLGNLMALSSFTGVGGASVEAMENLVLLQDATTHEELSQALANISYSGKENAASIMGNAYSGQDFSQTMGNYDFTQAIAPVRMKRRLGKLIGVAAATYFGGPQAGEAAADMMVGEWQATNGDFQGMMQSFGEGIEGGLKAWQDYSERGTTWGDDVMKGFRKQGDSANVSGATAARETSSASDTKRTGWFK